MRAASRLPILCTALLMALLLCTGCPLIEPPGAHKYTSADLAGRNQETGIPMPGGALDGFLDETESGAEEPREVVEPDVYYQDGRHLYVLNQYRGLIIVDLEQTEVIGQAPTFGYPRDLYVRDGRAYVLAAQAADYQVDDDTVSFGVASTLYVVDVSDPAAPEIRSAFPLEGDLVDSRLVGDVLYAVSAEYEWGWYEDVFFRQLDEAAGSWVTSVNVADPSNVFEVARVEFPGAGHVIQATDTAIFVTSYDWASDRTAIRYVDIDDATGALAVRGETSVPGAVADRFKMDSYDGVLRVASNGRDEAGQTLEVFLTTIDLSEPDALEPLAELQFEKAKGDTLFATRFDGDRAYIVTYFLKDPLFVVDLSEPTDPRIAGVLEVPGWSTHIEPRGDALVALGVDDTNGQRVSVSLFDVSDPAAPALIERESFGEGWSWSTAHSDVKAFTVLDDLLIVPFSGWNDTVGGFDRLQFVSWSPEGLEVGGYVDVQGSVLRSFAHDGMYYGLTTEQLSVIDATDRSAPVVADRVTLADNVCAFVPLANGVGAEVVARNDTATTLVRTHGLPLKAASELEIDLGEFRAAYPYGSKLALVGTEWSMNAYDGWWGYGDGRIVVALVDCETTPQLIAQKTLDVAPYHGYWAYPMPYLAEVDGAVGSGGADIAIAPWGGGLPWQALYGQDAGFVIDGHLVLRCTADVYDQRVGSATPEQGLAVFDLDAFELVHTIGLGYAWVESVSPGGAGLVIGHTEIPDTGLFDAGPPLVACMAALVDPIAGTAGPSVNVPGRVVRYDAAEDLLLLQDVQWRSDWRLDASLNTVRWDGGASISPLDALALPDGASQTLARGGVCYVDVYADGYRLYVVTIAADGAMTLGPSTLVTPQWGAVADATDTAAYVTIGGGAIARYGVGANGPMLTDLTPVMGLPTSMSFGDTQAYAALGYSGIVALPR